MTSSRDTQERVERVIIECGQLGVKPTPETVAQIMVDQDVHSTPLAPADAHGVYAEYAEIATRALLGEEAST